MCKTNSSALPKRQNLTEKARKIPIGESAPTFLQKSYILFFFLLRQNPSRLCSFYVFMPKSFNLSLFLCDNLFNLVILDGLFVLSFLNVSRNFFISYLMGQLCLPGLIDYGLMDSVWADSKGFRNKHWNFYQSFDIAKFRTLCGVLSVVCEQYSSSYICVNCDASISSLLAIIFIPFQLFRFTLFGNLYSWTLPACCYLKEGKFCKCSYDYWSYTWLMSTGWTWKRVSSRVGYVFAIWCGLEWCLCLFGWWRLQLESNFWQRYSWIFSCNRD